MAIIAVAFFVRGGSIMRLARDLSTMSCCLLTLSRIHHRWCRYTVISTVDEFNDASLSTPVIGLFALSHMSFERDRNPTDQPSLAGSSCCWLLLL